jgi:hypothetical protein
MQQRENMIYQRAIANCDWIGTSRKVTRHCKCKDEQHGKSHATNRKKSITKIP